MPVDLRVVRVLKTASREQTRWPVLDGIRGAAIVAVVAYHGFKIAGGWTSAKIRGEGVDWWWWPVSGGRLGVDLFFVLSGFLLWFSWQGLRKRHASLPRAVGAYARGRAVRILPPYYVMLAVYVPLLARELFTSGEGIWHLGLFATIQQFNEPSLPNLFNTPLWTLTVEVQFYFFLPLFAFLIPRLRPLLPLAATIALSSWWIDHRGVYPASFLLGRSDQFVAGMAVASIVARHQAGEYSLVARGLQKKATVWILAAGAAVLYLHHARTLGLPQDHVLDDWVHPGLGVTLAGIVGHLVLTDRPGRVHRFFEQPGARLVGHLSYGVYLWHFPLYIHALDWTGGAGGSGSAAAAGLLLATALTAAVSSLSYAWVERPFLERKARAAVSGSLPSSGPS
ncbi:MAG: acyltransferase [Actinobacteria bacterium]|nr:acyltransferase [Actinomycetota bacterium]